MAARLDQTTLTAEVFADSLRFYDAALGALGLCRTDELVDEEEDDAVLEAVAWGPPDGPAVLWLVTGAVPTRGAHVRFAAAGRDAVEAFFRDGVAAGGRPYAAPRRWTPYRRGEFNALVRDPAGNLIEAVAAE